MNPSPCGNIGFTCAYAPLPLIAAAGFRPFRILPRCAAPAQAGRFLHDNLCPHVKRVLDRALDGDLPSLAGMVVVNSCDAMRRLADAWRRVRPNDPMVLLDLPTTADDAAVAGLDDDLTATLLTAHVAAALDGAERAEAGVGRGRLLSRVRGAAGE